MNQLEFSMFNPPDALSPNNSGSSSDSKEPSPDPNSSQDQNSGRIFTPEEQQATSQAHQKLKSIVTERPVPFPLHVAFAWGPVPEERQGIAPLLKGSGSTVGFWEWTTGDRYKWGIPLTQLVEERSELAYADALAFEETQDSVRFELVWPGYLHRPWLVSLPLHDRNNQPIQWTRKDLGKFIALEYQKFAELCTSNEILCKEPVWRIGSNGGFAFQDMRIESFFNLTQDIWRADISISIPIPTSKLTGWAETQEEHYSLTGAEGCYSRIYPEGQDKRCPSCRKVHTPPAELQLERSHRAGKSSTRSSKKRS